MLYKFEFDEPTLRLILSGLDELQGKFSRQLVNQIVASAQIQENEFQNKKEKSEVKQQSEQVATENKTEPEPEPDQIEPKKIKREKKEKSIVSRDLKRILKPNRLAS